MLLILENLDEKKEGVLMCLREIFERECVFFLGVLGRRRKERGEERYKDVMDAWEHEMVAWKTKI